MKKVIFIPGFTGGKRDSIVAKNILKESDFYYFDYKTILTQSIIEISKELEVFIKSLKLKKGEKVNLLGVSAGGIIATYYARVIAPSKVEKLASMCSPFKGTFFGNIFPFNLKGLRELKLGSTLLKDLDMQKSKYKEKNYWCYFDFVVPGKSAKGKSPSWTWFFFHPAIQWWPPIIKDIKRFFAE